MSDADIAQVHELHDWERNNAPRKPLPKYAPDDKGYGPQFCTECGDDMPDLRREMGKLKCTDCTSAAEVNARKYAPA